MPAKSINHLAVWLAAIVFFIWGYIWYSVLFKGPVTAMMAQTNAQTSMTATPFIIGFLMALVIGYGTAIALANGEHYGMSHGISFGLFMGIIFYAAPTLSQNVFGGHPISWWLIDAGWAVIGFALVGAIVGAMKPKTAVATA